MGPMGTTRHFSSNSFDGTIWYWKGHLISIHDFVYRNVARPTYHHGKCQSPRSIMVLLVLLSGIMQTLCLIIYCSSPIMILSIVVFFMNLILHWFLLNLLLAVGALVFIIRSNKGLFKELVNADRQILSLYPVFLFYTFMCLFIAMT